MTDLKNGGMTTKDGQKRKGFYVHLLMFVLVNAGLLTMNSLRQPDRMWSYWVLLGWGAGVLLHAAKVFTCCACINWGKRKVRTVVKQAGPEANTQP